MSRIWKIICAVGIGLLGLLIMLGSGFDGGARLRAYLKKRDAQKAKDQAEQDAAIEELQQAVDKANKEANDASHDSASAGDSIRRSTR
jgi:hypothetical protein